MEIESLIKTIIQCAYNVRTHLAAGFLESVYQKALMIELKEKGIHADTEMPINVYYKDEIVGEFRADIIHNHGLVNGAVVCRYVTGGTKSCTASSSHTRNPISKLLNRYQYRPRLINKLWR